MLTGGVKSNRRLPQIHALGCVALTGLDASRWCVRIHAVHFLIDGLNYVRGGVKKKAKVAGGPAGICQQEVKHKYNLPETTNVL